MTQRTHQTCGDCGVQEGQLHDYFPHCDQEVCPFCLGQLNSCEHGPLYHDSMTAVRRKGRIRFIEFPQLCARCGVHWPDFFMVPDRTWKKVVPKTHWEAILCRACFDSLSTL